MRILITGATGFIGTTLVQYLFKNGLKDMAVVVRSKEKALNLFPKIPLNLILSNDTMEQEIKFFNPEIVIHLAAFFSGKDDFETAKQLIDSNILFTTRLLISLEGTSCKAFINTGTFTEFIHGAGDYYPNNLYSATKNAVRSIIRLFQIKQGWKWINVIIYSPYGRKNHGIPKIIDHLLKALNSDSPQPFSEGKQKLDFIHVDDISDFYLNLINKFPELKDKYYEFHLGSGDSHSICEIAEIIEEEFGKTLNADWGAYPYRNNESMHTVAPISKNITVLNWKPSLSIREGIKILKSSIQENV